MTIITFVAAEDEVLAIVSLNIVLGLLLCLTFYPVVAIFYFILLQKIQKLAIVHMSDQYTRISSGGSPLDKNAPVVGLLFGLRESSVLQIKDADDIPVEVSDASNNQVDLHKAVFPQHKVVGWYRVSVDNEEPTAQDLSITQTLKAHHAPSDSFCFCLLQVQQQQQQQKKNDNDAMKTDDGKDATSTNKDLPINLYELHEVENTSVLLGLTNWQLETSEPERIAVERVMKEKPSDVDDGSPSQNPYVLETKSIQLSLAKMKERVHVLVTVLTQMQEGNIPVDPNILRQVQGLVCSLGPLSSMAETASGEEDGDVQMLAHLSIVAQTINSIQSYTDKFRVMHESRSIAKEMRRAF